MKFSIKDFFSKGVDLVIFTEENLKGKLHSLCSAMMDCKISQWLKAVNYNAKDLLILLSF